MNSEGEQNMAHVKTKRTCWRISRGLLGILAVSGVAHAEVPLAAAITGGRADIDLRARYENVDDASKLPIAQAGTLRARLGYETATWNNFQFAFDIDQIWTLGGATYNSTRNGKTVFPVVADPAMTTLDRLQLTYAPGFETKITIGRQRLLIGDQRFIGNVGWRQHEQTFDSISAVNSSVRNLTLTYAYLYRVNRIGGPDIPVPSTTTAAATGQANSFKSNSHVFDAVYAGLNGFRFEAYTFLLDLAAPGYATSPAQQTATAKLSTATYGGRADYSLQLADGLTGKISGEFVHQTNYAANPLSFGLDYWLGEASVTYRGLMGLTGYEALGGNGAIGFSTPLATLHAFDGWADMFLSTPANGLNDAYVKASYVVPANFAAMKSLTGTIAYHSFSTDKFAKGIGSEWDAQAELAIDGNSSFLLKYASYQGSNATFGGYADKSIFWLQTAYKY